MKKWLAAFFILIVILGSCQNAADDKEKDEADKEETTEEENNAASETEEPVGIKVPVEVKDESGENPDVAAFVEALKQVITDRDAEKLLKMVSDEVTYSFGEEDGKTGFVKKWKLNAAPDDSPIWNELADIVENGGAFAGENGNEFVMPYIAAHFPEQFDPMTYGAILGEEVNMRSNPTVDSDVVEQLTYEVVKVGEPLDETYEMNGREYHWVQIETTLGAKGYVVEKFVRRAGDYRIVLSETDTGAWQITSFIAGD